jgi:hypothetical protein
MKKRMFAGALALLVALAVITGCESAPDAQMIEEAVRASLRNAVPIDLNERTDLCRAVSVDEITILETGQQRTLKTADHDVPYWPVTISTKGRCLPVFHVEGDTLPFEGQATMYMFYDERSEAWVAERKEPQPYNPEGK